jgi:hypothetical protein
MSATTITRIKRRAGLNKPEGEWRGGKKGAMS